VLVLLFARFAASAQQLASLRGDLLAMIAYVANWRFLVTGTEYGGVDLSPSPVLHAWSLSIEEQFYVLFPLLLVLAHRLGRRRGIAVAVGTLLVASAVVGVLVSGDPNRVYYGTDVRALELLVGAAGALAVRSRLGPAARRAAPALAPVALVVIGVLWATASATSPWLSRGILAAHAVATLVVMVAAGEAGRLARACAWRPLVALGAISYGVYLYHWPVFLWLTPRRLGLDPWAAAPVRLAVTLVLAVVSARLLEAPARATRRSPATVLRIAGVATALSALVVVTASPVSATGDRITIRGGLVGPGDVAAAPAPTTTTTVMSTTTVTRAPSTTATPVLSADAVTDLRALEALEELPPVDPARFLRPSPPPAPLEPPTGRPPRVLVVGDSAAATLGEGLQRWGARTGALEVWVSGWIACPVTRGGEIRWVDGIEFRINSDCNRWPETRARELRKVDPDVVVALSGVWEVTDRRFPKTDTWVHVGQPEMDLRILADVAAFTDLHTSRGASVLWLLHPPVLPSVMAQIPSGLPEEDPVRMARLNELVRQVVAEQPRAATFDLPAYQATSGQDPMARRPDGFHWSNDGADVEAAWLGPLLVEMAGSPG
jgi:peptidoglycan/LPS O-acetylase OafA/YrhL